MNWENKIKSQETIRQPRKRHSEALSNKFYWIYQESDVFDDKEILFIDSRTVVRESTTIEQAKREVQSFIRSIGGNTAMHLKVERRESWLSYTPRYTVSANAALVVPSQLNNETKEGLRLRFERAISLEDTEARPCPSSCRKVPYLLVACGVVMGVCAVLAWITAK